MFVRCPGTFFQEADASLKAAVLVRWREGTEERQEYAKRLSEAQCKGKTKLSVEKSLF